MRRLLAYVLFTVVIFYFAAAIVAGAALTIIR